MDGDVSCCLHGEIDLDGFLWFLNSYWERAQNQMPHLCSSLSHQGFSSCREWRRCLTPVWSYSSAKRGERTPVGPWPPHCPQWSLCVRFLLAAVTIGLLLRWRELFLFRVFKDQEQPVPLSSISWDMLESIRLFLLPLLAEFFRSLDQQHMVFISHCKPRAHGRAQSEMNLGTALVYLAVKELFPSKGVLDWQSGSRHWAKLQSCI